MNVKMENANLTSLGPDTFATCSQLRSIELPVKTVSLAARVFQSCTSLTGIQSDYVDKIGERIFRRCSSLSSVYFPNLLKLENYAFQECTSLSSVDFPLLSSTGINAFDGASSLTDANLSSLISLESNVFRNCTQLKNLDLSSVSGIPSGYFKNYAFSNKPSFNLKSCKILGDQAFWGTDISSVYFEELESIGSNSFKNCKYLNEIEFPKTLSAGSYAFHGSNIQHISMPSAITLGDGCFDYCTKLSGIELPNASTLGAACFAFCSSLSSIELPNVTTIGNDCFWQCTKLSSIELPNVATLGNYCFFACIELSGIEFPESLSFIGTNCFESCTKLTSIKLNSIPNIALSAFTGITSKCLITCPWSEGEVSGYPWGADLNNVSFIFEDQTELPDIMGMEYLPANLFKGRTGVSGLDLSIVKGIGSSCFLNSDIDEVDAPVLLSAGTSAFDNCDSLTAVDAPMLSSIGYTSFANCENLSSVYAPNLKTIGDAAFVNCYSLASIDISSVSALPASCFDGCSSLTTVNAPLASSLAVGCFYRCSSLSSVNLPSLMSLGFGEQFKNLSSLVDIDIHNVTGTIYFSSFNNCISLSSISIPSATQIEADGFHNCSSLVSAYLPSVNQVGYSAFSNTALRTVDLPKATKLYHNAFSGCSGLMNADLPSVDFIDRWSFRDCISLSGISIPNATIISFDCFYNCSSLLSLDIPLVSSLGSQCFYNCSSLSSVTLSSVADISTSAFYGCSSLTDLALPSTVQNIGNDCFKNSGLSSISLSSVPTLGSSSFDFGSSTQNVVVNLPWPSGTIAGEPWGADTSKVTFIYDEEGEIVIPEPEFDWSSLVFHMPLSADLDEAVSGRAYTFSYGSASDVAFTTFNSHACADIPGNTKSTNQFGITFAAAALAGVPTGNNDISMSMWFSPKANSTGSAYFTFLRYGQKTNNNALNLGGRHAQKIYAGIEGAGDIGDKVGDTSDITSQTGKWYHHVVTYNKTTGIASVYLNNILIGTTSGTMNIVLGTTGLKIANTNRQCDSRYVHDIRIFNKCLTTDEIKWLYDNQC